jgi:hypothetical protein
MMEAVRTSETSVDNHFTRQYIPEDNSEQKRWIMDITVPFLLCSGMAGVAVWVKTVSPAPLP